MRMQRTGGLCLIALVVIVSAGCAGNSRNEDAPAGLVNTIWLHLHQDWAPAPPEVESDEGTAPATLVRFASNHEFWMLHCLLSKIPLRALSRQRYEAKCIR